jgi:hypothetical protein
MFIYLMIYSHSQTWIIHGLLLLLGILLLLVAPGMSGSVCAQLLTMTIMIVVHLSLLLKKAVRVHRDCGMINGKLATISIGNLSGYWETINEL